MSEVLRTPGQAATRDIQIGRKVNGERVVLLGWAPAILMQFAHPLVAAGVAEHSTAMSRPETRLHRLHATIAAMLALTFGDETESAHAADAINAIHRRVRGTLAEGSGPFSAGTAFTAQDPVLLAWVHATLLYALPRAYELFVGPLSAEEKDRYCREAMDTMIQIGIPRTLMPRSRADLFRYLEGMLTGDAITIGGQARALAHELLMPPVPAVVRPLLIFCRLPAIGLLPPSLRAAYGFRWNRRRECGFRLFAWVVRHLLPLVPALIRYWPPARQRPRPARMRRIPISGGQVA